MRTSVEPKLVVWKPTTAVAVALWTAPALAHHVTGGETPRTLAQGLLSGLAHPILALDHLLFLVVAGLLIHTLAPASRHLVPGAFVAGTVLGSVLRPSAGTPFTEVAILVSLVAGAVVLVSGRRATAGGSSLFLALAGVFHGLAYGEAMVGAASAVLLAYLLGLSVTQYLMIAGIARAAVALRRNAASENAPMATGRR